MTREPRGQKKASAALLGEQAALVPGRGQEPAADDGPAAEKHAACRPVARVMVEVPAIIFDRPFDYRVPEALATTAMPGMRVRVRLNNSVASGVIWSREEATADGRPVDSLRPIDAVISSALWVPAGLRRDFEAIAADTGGTVSQLLRLALPDPTPSLEKRPGWNDLLDGHAATHEPDSARLEEQEARMRADYRGLEAVDGSSKDPHAPVVWDVLPGTNRWAEDAAWLVCHLLAHGRKSLVELPDARHVTLLLDALAQYGLSRLELRTKSEIAALRRQIRESRTIDEETGESKNSDGTKDKGRKPRLSDIPVAALAGDVAVIDSDDTPTQRALGLLAAANGAAQVVIGTRATMYAAMPEGSAFMAVDDDAYQDWDGFMPYAGVRGVLTRRARLNGGTYVSMGLARSAACQQSLDEESAVGVTPTDEAVDRLLPSMDWLSHDRLVRLADPALGSRIPHRAVQALRDGLERGPVLVVPGSSRSFSLFVCASCGRQARCPRCAGPLAFAGRGRAPVCAWCGAPAMGWKCPDCGGTRLRIGRFGMGGTADQVRSLLPDAHLIVREKIDPAKAPHGSKGLNPEIPDEPCVVVAAAQSIPQVVEDDGSTGGYRAVVLLDAWIAAYSQRLDGLTDMLSTWMSVASHALPASRGGTALLVGDCPDDMGESWEKWRPGILAQRVLRSRRKAGLPPAFAAASVWGRSLLVRQLLSRIGALDGDFATISVPIGDEGLAQVPSVMGPLPIRPQEAMRRSPTFEGAGDRVRCVVRVPREKAGELAYRLRVVAANIEREGRHGELRFWVGPKDLRER